MYLFIQPSIKVGKLREGRVFIPFITISPVPGAVSGTYWELHKYVLIEQRNLCPFSYAHPQCFYHLKKLTQMPRSFLCLPKQG